MDITARGMWLQELRQQGNCIHDGAIIWHVSDQYLIDIDPGVFAMGVGTVNICGKQI